MSNPFSVLEELSSPKIQKNKKKSTPKKKNNAAQKKKAVAKKNTKIVEKRKLQPSAKPKKQIVLIPQAGSNVKASENSEFDSPNAGTTDGGDFKRNFDGPQALKNYKRDGKKGYYNRKPGQPANKGKRYVQRDKSSRSGKKFQRNGVKNGEGGSHNWSGKPERYVKKRPQEMTDEEWDKQLKVDEQKQKKELSKKKGGKKKPFKASEKKGNDDKPKDALNKNGDNKKRDFKKGDFKKGDFKKGDKKKDFKKKDYKKKDFKKKDYKKSNEDRFEEPLIEEDQSDDEGKETYEDFVKNRKKPVTLNDSKARKAGEGVNIKKNQFDFVRTLSTNDTNYMKVTKKKKGKSKGKGKPKGEAPKEGETVKTTPKKKKKKVVSTAEFFSKTTPKGKDGKRFAKNLGKKGKKTAPDFKDKQSFPSLS